MLAMRLARCIFIVLAEKRQTAGYYAAVGCVCGVQIVSLPTTIVYTCNAYFIELVWRPEIGIPGRSVCVCMCV